MRRKHYLVLTGLTLAQHQGMARNDLLPFSSTEAIGWGNFTPKQVFFTCLALALANMVGGQAEAASRVAAFPGVELGRIWSTSSKEGAHDVWGASIRSELDAWTGWAVGPIAEVLNVPASFDARRPVQGRSIVEIAKDLDSLALVNLSQLHRQIVARAKAAGIPFGPLVEPLTSKGEADA